MGGTVILVAIALSEYTDSDFAESPYPLLEVILELAFELVFELDCDVRLEFCDFADS